MAIPFTCPHCGAQTNVDDQYAGQTGPCAGCGQPITVPPSTGTPTASGATDRSSAGPVIALVVVGILAALLVCGGVMVVFYLRFSGLSMGGMAGGQAQCTNNLKQIGLAMHNYHDVYGCLPAAVLTDDDDRPMRSWRVAILPFVEQGPIYDIYDFDEPWDGPNNSIMLEVLVSAYRCPNDYAMGPGQTSYVMVVGEGALGGLPNEKISIADILDGTSNTIMAIEVSGAGIPWAEPRDITVEEAVTLITNPAASQFSQIHPGGANVVFADGAVRFVPNSIDPQMLRAMLTKADGQAITLDF